MMDRVTRVMVEIIVRVSWQQWYSLPFITTGGQVVVKHGCQKSYRTLIIYSTIYTTLYNHSRKYEVLRTRALISNYQLFEL